MSHKPAIFFCTRFLPVDTNLVLREFEKCGIILKHVPGPRDANWMNILYQVYLSDIFMLTFMQDDMSSPLFVSFIILIVKVIN